MRIVLALMLASVVGCYDPKRAPPVEPNYPPGTTLEEACSVACERLRSIGCGEGHGVIGGATCTATCIRSSELRSLPLACWASSQSPADARACCSDGNCYATGEDCKAATCVKAGGACTDSQYCCTGLTCQSGRCDTPGPTCRKAGVSCLTSDVCCAGLTCSRFGLTCQAATRLDLGEPCATNTQCLSGRCEGYCTKSCATNVQCTDVTFCVSTGAGTICVPWCAPGSNTKCSVYAGATCQATTDVDGTGVMVCLGR